MIEVEAVVVVAEVIEEVDSEAAAATVVDSVAVIAEAFVVAIEEVFEEAIVAADVDVVGPLVKLAGAFQGFWNISNLL